MCEFLLRSDSVESMVLSDIDQRVIDKTENAAEQVAFSIQLEYFLAYDPDEPIRKKAKYE